MEMLQFKVCEILKSEIYNLYIYQEVRNFGNWYGLNCVSFPMPSKKKDILKSYPPVLQTVTVIWK